MRAACTRTGSRPATRCCSASRVGVAAPIGDLFESKVKRDAGTKDTGTLFGAHGGALDRLDAALFTLVAGYYVWTDSVSTADQTRHVEATGRRTGRRKRDRQMIELLNELRVALPGVQILFAFLLTVPFSAALRRQLTRFQRDVYFVTLIGDRVLDGMPDRARRPPTGCASTRASGRGS